jgi:hypothetical protein
MTAVAVTRRAAQAVGQPSQLRIPHVHSFSHLGDDPFSSAALYRCRCGVVRPGF